MSAIDNAFIRAFTTDAAGLSASQITSPERTLRKMAPAKSNQTAISADSARGSEGGTAAANRVNRPHFKTSALRTSVQHTIVPAPHIDLSKFAHTATTVDLPGPATIPVRIDPAAIANLKPHAAAKVGVPPGHPLGRGGRAREFEIPERIPAEAGTPTADPEVQSQREPREGRPAEAGSPTVTPRSGFEVDRLAWPDACDALIERSGSDVDELAQELMAEAALGRKVIAVSGDSRGAGATTLALVLSRRLAKSGAKVVLVDADFAAPQLAVRLGLVIGIGWETVLALPEKTSLWDTMVESIEDRLTVVPLASRSRLNVSTEIAGRVVDCLSQLREAFDLVLVDAGPISASDSQSNWLTAPGNGLDAAILACDVRSAEAERLTEIGRRLLDAKIAPLGVAENFCTV